MRSMPTERVILEIVCARQNLNDPQNLYPMVNMIHIITFHEVWIEPVNMIEYYSLIWNTNQLTLR